MFMGSLGPLCTTQGCRRDDSDCDLQQMAVSSPFCGCPHKNSPALWGLYWLVLETPESLQGWNQVFLHHGGHGHGQPHGSHAVDDGPVPKGSRRSRMRSCSKNVAMTMLMFVRSPSGTVIMVPMLSKLGIVLIICTATIMPSSALAHGSKRKKLST